MATIKIHSRLKHFTLVARIEYVSGSHIGGEVRFKQMPPFGVLEAMAQLAALHVRHRLKLERHAFLLKVNHSLWPAQDMVEGNFAIWADLYSQSSNSFAYQVHARGAGGVTFFSDLLIGTKTYDNQYRKDALQAHYKKIFGKLQVDFSE